MSEVSAFAEGREGDVAGLLRHVNDWAGVLNERLTTLAREHLDGRDRTGAVRARVSGAGRLVGLTIDPRGLRHLDNVQLAQAVMEAIAAARSAMGDRLTELTADLAGPDLPDGDPLAPHVERLLREG
ncbi:YbaB/EbfC family nucleoid-associated protein [Nonomuraea terrae]|uniref:YbaB/EbfC family nucleoid-associated protein n=1 Tax=Nonomuraea terrae TaxID=2530383 RepID=UPI0037AF1F3E